MKITRNIQVPTGNICIAEGEKGKDLEFLSLGDYGSNLNVKASFLGLEREIEGVPNGEIMSLEEKWVITISTQYGCSMGCTFCDVPKVGPGVNVTDIDLENQIVEAIKLHPEVRKTKRLNIHYARMGEPTFNHRVLNNAMILPDLIKPLIGDSLIHPVISTMLPRSNKNLSTFLTRWCHLKNEIYNGDAGLQFSINSTNDQQRFEMFNNSSLPLYRIMSLGQSLPTPLGRKYTLNFALADNYEVDAEKLIKMFDPNKFMVKITPLHKTKSCVDNNIKTSGGYTEFTPYQKIEQELKDVGFDVLIFIPSIDEDLGRITCGNAILSGTMPETDYKEMT